jgi:hypothetical protein
MKRTLLIVSVLTLWLGTFVSTKAAPLGTAFTYQGRLNEGAALANGQYDLRFGLFDDRTAGVQLPPTLTTNNIPVSNGLFTVTLDFGSSAFAGDARWLEIAVRTNGAASFSPLSPRQPLTPAPYSLYASGAGSAVTAGTASSVAANGVNALALQAASITAPKIASGQVVKSLNGLHDDLTLAAGLNLTLTPSGNTLTFDSPTWSLTGNSGTGPANFLGTTDNQPLELRVNGSRGLRLSYLGKSSGPAPILFLQRSINVIGGYWGNSVANDVIGATIAGGGEETGLVFSPNPFPNSVTDDFGSVGGGYSNTAGNAATVPGGYNNSALGVGSFAAGRNAHVTHNGSFLWGDGTQAANSSGPNRFEVLSAGGMNFYHGPNGVNIDQLNGNIGDVNYSLRFGVGSGEAIGSKRNAGGNQYGLDFYTSFANRMSIANNGYVGINTTSPQQQLDVNGQFLVVDGSGGEQAYLGGDGFGNDVQIGSLNPNVSNVAFYNAGNGSYMHIYCKACTITGGADLAEPFPISTRDKEKIPEGSVVVIDPQHPGHLKMSDQAYDTRVAGIISGANGVHAGLQLQQEGVLEGGQNVALTGRVYVQADAGSAPIQPGDLLTTSSVPGRAMKVIDKARARGAILGKAMTDLPEGLGQVLVLVTLQ